MLPKLHGANNETVLTGMNYDNNYSFGLLRLTVLHKDFRHIKTKKLFDRNTFLLNHSVQFD